MLLFKFTGNSFHADYIAISLETALNIGQGRLNQFMAGIAGQTSEQTVKQNSLKDTFFNIVEILCLIGELNSNLINLLAGAEITAFNEIMPQMVYGKILPPLDFRAAVRNELLKFTLSDLSFQEIEHTALVRPHRSGEKLQNESGHRMNWEDSFESLRLLFALRILLGHIVGNDGRNAMPQLIAFVAPIRIDDMKSISSKQQRSIGRHINVSENEPVICFFDAF